MADKINIEELGLPSAIEGFEDLTKKINLTADAMSTLIDQSIALRKNLDTADTIKLIEAQQNLDKTYNQSKITEKELLNLQEKRQKVVLNDLRIKKLQEAEQKKLTRTELDFDEVIKRETKSLTDMKNKVKDLQKVRSELNLSEKEGIKNNKEAVKEIDKLNKKIKENSDADTQRTKGIGKYQQAIQSAATRGAAALGMLWGAWEFGKKIIASTDRTMVEFEGIMNGLKESSISFFKTVATGTFTFKGLITSFKEAYEIGKQYAKTLDEIEDKQRGLSIREKEAETQKLILMRIIRNVGLEDSKRIEAAKQFIAIEDKLAAQREKYAKQAFDLEVETNLARIKSGKVNKEQFLEYIKSYDDQYKFSVRDAETNSKLEKWKTLNKKKNLTEQEQAEKTSLYNQLKEYQKMKLGLLRVDTYMGDLSDEEMDKLAKSWRDYLDAHNSFYENTMNAERRLNQLVNKEEKKDRVQKLEEIKSITNEQIKEINEFVKNAQDKIKQLSESQINGYIEAYNERYEAFKRSGDEIDLSEEAFLTKELDRMSFSVIGLNLSEKEKEKIFKKLRDLRIRLDDDATEREQRNQEKLLEAQARRKEALMDMYNQAFTIASSFLQNEITATEQAEQRKLAIIDARLKQELAAAGTNEDQKAKIEARAEEERYRVQKEFAIKKAVLERKAAIFDKAQAMIEIAIQTAVNAVKLATKPALMIAAIALGVAEEAIVAAKPLPQIPEYAKGRKAKPYAEVALVSEEGREGLKKNGKYIGLTPDVPTIMNIPAGVEIEPNKVLEKEIARFDGSRTQGLEIVQLNENIKYLTKAMKERPETYIDMTANTFRIHAKRGLNRTEYINRKFRHKC